MDMRKSGLTSTADSGSYSDLNRLNQLKVGDDKNSEGNMRKVAQEFESLFLNEMLKSMRSATEVLGKDNPMNTPAAKQYQEMYDQQLAVSMSREGGGIGLADVLMRQMQKNKPVDAQAATLQGPAAAEPAKKADVPTEIAAGTQATGPLGRSNGQRPLWAYRVAEPQSRCRCCPQQRHGADEPAPYRLAEQADRSPARRHRADHPGRQRGQGRAAA